MVGVRRFGLGLDHRVAFAVIGPPFAVADDNEAGAGVLDHRGGNVAGVRAALGSMAILRTDADQAGFLARRVDQGERRRQGHLDLHQALGGAIDGARFRQHRTGPVHLPVADNIRTFRHRC